MTSLRGASHGVFELQRSSSFQGIQPTTTHRYASENSSRMSNHEVPEGAGDFEEEEVDESVREDMNKLEDTFPGISDRFRLVNRIGEGIELTQ